MTQSIINSIFELTDECEIVRELRTMPNKALCRFNMAENYAPNKSDNFRATVTLVVDDTTEDVDLYVTSSHLPQYMMNSIDFATFERIIEDLYEFCHGGIGGNRSEALQEALDEPFIVEYEFEEELNKAFDEAEPVQN